MASKDIKTLEAQIELLQAIRDEYIKRELEKKSAVADRLARYEKIAGLLGKVRVSFSDRITDGFGGPPGSAIGEVEKENGTHFIRISPGLPLNVEHSVFLHELFHGLIHKPPDLSALDRRDALIVRDAYMSREFHEKSGIDGREELENAHDAQERECNALARMAFPVMFPGESYAL